MRALFWINLAATVALAAFFVGRGGARRPLLPPDSAQIGRRPPAAAGQGRSARPPVLAQPRAAKWEETISAIRAARAQALETHSPAAVAQAELKRTTVIRRYAYLLDALRGLRPSVRRQVLQLLYERDVARQDVREAAVRLGVSDAYETDAVARSQTDGMDQRLALLCGADGGKALELLGLEGAMSELSIAISPNMDFAGVPLSPNQAVQMATIMKNLHLAEGDPVFSDVGRRPADAPGGFQEIALELVRAAGPVLAPEQAQVLADFVREWETNQAEGARRRRGS